MDGIEHELAGKASVVRLNIHSNSGKMLADRHNVEFVPTFIFFNDKGEEEWRRSGEILSKDEFLAAVTKVTN